MSKFIPNHINIETQQVTPKNMEFIKQPSIFRIKTQGVVNKISDD